MNIQTRVLEELARVIQKELAAADKPIQLRLDLFNESGRDQYRRNIEALRAPGADPARAGAGDE